ncbi:uncharacterized protein K452DRAFT_292028 [Aplosporella prunicola CBS 121167]|uniref:Altered inheritance of mitochondria protein 11 n=1 Tax=Aplosporella prunicola CBS 121167 TaxID=1176127 RepID=A0A6A6AY81_9PEZI|nr:uncharacterized protein K452DRAFT_292028 [Aplosporella prunicola CBS 121167]KAF2136889.1 hypothetical protein K452DRAFT_292028 [Aplosporella prunicola CBS 121167]
MRDSSAGEPQQASLDQPRRSLLDTFVSRRSFHQLGLFCAGATFFTVAQLITRRSLIRRYKAILPPFYHPNNRPHGEVNGALDAFEAFNLATLHVVSASIMFAGGAMWATDISTLDDLRQKVRHRIGTGDEAASDREIEEWVTEVMARNDMNSAIKAATGMDLQQIMDKAKTEEQKSGDKGKNA